MSYNRIVPQGDNVCTTVVQNGLRLVYCLLAGGPGGLGATRTAQLPLRARADEYLRVVEGVCRRLVDTPADGDVTVNAVAPTVAKSCSLSLIRRDELRDEQGFYMPKRIQVPTNFFQVLWKRDVVLGLRVRVRIRGVWC